MCCAVLVLIEQSECIYVTAIFLEYLYAPSPTPAVTCKSTLTDVTAGKACPFLPHSVDTQRPMQGSAVSDGLAASVHAYTTSARN